MLLANYLLGPEPQSFNSINEITLGDAGRELYERYCDVSLTEADDGFAHRGQLQAAMASNNADINFIKSHTANIARSEFDAIDVSLTKQVIYIVRDPLDVCVSFADYFRLSEIDAVKAMADPEFTIPGGRHLVTQYVGSWSGNVTSWLDADTPVELVRYEDLHQHPVATLERVLSAIGVGIDRDRLAVAVENSAFEALRRAEAASGFHERAPGVERFFRSGLTGQGRRHLQPSSIEAAEAAHGETMRRLGYLRSGD